MDKQNCDRGNSCCGKPAPGGDDLACPLCGQPGEIVPGGTVRKLLKPGLAAAADRYLVCTTPGCAAVYFHPKGGLFKQEDVSVPVYFKTGAEPVFACYCAGVTKAQVLAAVEKTKATRWATIIKEITGAVPKCNCEAKNPLGKCCSGNAYAAAIAGSSAKPVPAVRSRDPLHGLTLEAILTYMLDRHGWEGLWRRIPINCFKYDPGMKSSLVFLRANPWAREKLENWYVCEVPKPKKGTGR
ncbi:MAG TPA: VF530 family DNA-binding protein [Elusimicrobiales bacterium]|nr:VF530 family DNA-binding protein [Elusimicrobiales bacterium]